MGRKSKAIVDEVEVELDDSINIDDFIEDIMSNEDDEESSDSTGLTVHSEGILTTNSSDNSINLDEKHSLANRIVENSLDVIKNSKMLFTSFSDDVLHGKDRSSSSKETLIKALEVQNQANKNLIDLARTLDGEKGGNTNILIASSVSPKTSGIDPNNIRNHLRNL